MLTLLKRIIKPIAIIPYIFYIQFKRKCVIKLPSKISISSTNLEGYNTIHKSVFLENSIVGFGTYIGPNCMLNNTKIGKFCSISWNVNIISRTHPTKDFVSTHPAFFSLGKQSGFTFVSTQKFSEVIMADKNYTITIGNDVWIGANVTILGGVKIGDGAIVSTGSIVTKDIEPYTLVGGIPARIIRYRFTKEQINFLLNFRWWDKDVNWIKENSDLFSDISIFMKSCNDS